ncbi:hypothetical protein BDN70DRAFT_488449 [Pholiota conissans]|uniref:Single-stranded DNA-binding protein n=1 Tax=Pholiota conissans TaxID=109636 RepID=A0A9P5Z6K0_9AGAR|nr:hypothetical protein BDN70DRAFT_488449 [Pholiota conissans]
MLSILRSTASRALSTRGFATTRPTADLAKLTLVGTLVKEPEARLTKNEKEYVVYVVATRNQRLPPNADGERPPTTSTFHRIVSFNENSSKFLKTLRKGAKVYIEAGLEMREPEPGADPSTPLGQRQIFLRHGKLQVCL